MLRTRRRGGGRGGGDKKKQTNKMNADLPNTRNARVQRNAQMGFWMRKLRGLDTLIY